MQLREIRVTGFGTLANVRLCGMGPGLNVLFGPNEFGKTSLLEFCRRVLFGFPTRREGVNPYPSLRSDRYGGQLGCQLLDGRRLTLAREAGRGGGRLTVTQDDGRVLTQAEFDACLGHVTPEFYRNVFALDLHELSSVDIARQPEVNDRIIGAGLGLGQRGLPELREPFQRRADELFTRTGRKKQMQETAARITALKVAIHAGRESLATYDARRAQRAAQEAGLAAMGDKLRELQSRRRALEDQERLHPVFMEMRRAESELAALGHVPDVRDSVMAELGKLVECRNSAALRQQEREKDLRDKRHVLDRIAYNPALIDQADEIRSLSQNAKGYRAAQQELPRLSEELDAARSRAARALASIGPDWTADRARAFVLDAQDEDALRRTQQRFRSAENTCQDRRRKLEVHRDQGRAGSRPGLPRIVPVIGVMILVLGAAGSLLAAARGDAAGAVVSGTAAALGLALALTALRGGAGVDTAGAAFEAELRTAEAELEEARFEWAALLERVGLAPSLSPEGKDQAESRIRDACRDLERVDELGNQVARHERTIAAVEKPYRQVLEAVGQEAASTDVASDIERLTAEQHDASDARVRQETLANDVRQLEREVAQRTEEAAAAESALAAFLTAQGVSSTEELEEARRRAEEADKLRQEVSSAFQSIEAAVGAGQAGALIRALECADLPAVGAELQELAEALPRDEAARDDALRGLATLDEELRRLATDEELACQEAELQTLLARLSDQYRDWLGARMALWGIAEAVSRYEEERQPDVIRAAEGAFVAMTGGRYSRIIQPADQSGLRVRDDQGEDRSPGQLSRGTREQLYLAVRLGLIEQYERTAEPLPVIMDDILVNFDDDRGPRAVKALADFASRRQVIVMTCHDRTRRLYLEAGARELQVERA